MVGKHPKGWRCPACNPKPDLHIAGRPGECPLCEVPLGPNYTCPTCDHTYRTDRSGRFILPSDLVENGTLLAECRTPVGVQKLYRHKDFFALLDDYDEKRIASSYRKIKPRDLTDEKAMGMLRLMAGVSAGAGVRAQTLSVGYDPETCRVTPEGRALLGAARRAAPKPARSCACATVAKAKAGKRSR